MQWEYNSCQVYFYRVSKKEYEWRIFGAGLPKEGADILAGLNWLGQQGWELAGIQKLEDGTEQRIGGYQAVGSRYVFKRPIGG